MLPLVSIVIPCYNSGKFIPEAVQSVKSYQGKHVYEIIIVDDGSTDDTTLQVLKQLENEGCIILHQENKGPAGARNTGIKHAKAPYILFLDSDNKIRPEYIDEGVKALENHPEVGVAYGNPSFFGDVSRSVFKPKKFNIRTMIVKNYIDMCAMIRKEVWTQTGGLDENRALIGHEDWDFWIRVYQKDWQFIHIDKTLFDYRLREGSLISQSSSDSIKKKIELIYGKHALLIRECYKQTLNESITYSYDQGRPVNSFIKYLKLKYLNQRAK